MRDYQKFLGLFLIAVAVAGITSMLTLSEQRQSGDKEMSPQKSKKMIDFENRLLVATYEVREPVGTEERDKRAKKARKFESPEYDDLTVDINSDVVTTFSHWASGLTAIPVDRSSAIIIGNIRTAQAYVSPSKKRVYSEFTVNVSEILKDDINDPIKFGNPIIVDRIGGRVQFPNGKIGQYWIAGQGMPRIGGDYLLFLTQPSKGAGFSILTGYELLDGRVSLLDNPGGGHPIALREGSDETSFLNEVRAAFNNH